MQMGIQLLIYGLSGVFLALVLFYALIRIFLAIQKKKSKRTLK